MALRLPSVLAVLLIVLLIYGYSRTFLSPLGAAAAAISFATMGQVAELGMLGETEALFTLWVSGSLLIWHWGYLRDPPGRWSWIAAYALAGLGMLTKGVQGPAYLVLPVRRLFAAHRPLARCGPPLALGRLGRVRGDLGCLASAVFQQQGWPDTRAILGYDIGLRFDNAYLRWGTILKHFGSYPFEVAACLLPWSVLLLPYFSRRFRNSLGPVRRQVVFLAGAILVTFRWLVPAKSRYFMPLYPCFAPWWDW